MNSVADYFHTDWAAMTASDWVGTIVTVAVFVLLMVVYFEVFRPKNRDRLEAQKHIPFEVDNESNGDKDGGK